MKKPKLSTIIGIAVIICLAVVTFANVPGVQARIKNDSMFVSIADVYELVTGEKLEAANANHAVQAFKYYMSVKENNSYSDGYVNGDKNGFARAENEANRTLDNKLAADRAEIFDSVTGYLGRYGASAFVNMYDANDVVKNYNSLFDEYMSQNPYAHLYDEDAVRKATFDDVLMLAKAKGFVDNEFNSNDWNYFLTTVYQCGKNVGNLTINQQITHIVKELGYERDLLEQLTGKGLAELIWYVSQQATIDVANKHLTNSGARINPGVIECENPNDTALIKQILGLD